MNFFDALGQCPYVAILRGVQPDEVVSIAEALYALGFRLIEVPTNSPDPFESIARLQQHFQGACLVGAGTVVEVSHVEALAMTGSDLAIAPNVDEAVIRKAKSLSLTVIPGFMTPSEAYTAIHAGADALKVFPCNLVTPESVKAMRTILPSDVPVLAVGGVTPENQQAYRMAGVSGFGLGSAVYSPGDTPARVREKAGRFFH
jgi:2-dehydro-3-deoxyphosphogalactonate aldolase